MNSRLILPIIGILAFLFIAFSTAFTVDQGERVVVTRWGKISYVAEPGLHFKLPITDSANVIGIRNNSRFYENVSTYSKDQQPSLITLSVNWRVLDKDVAAVYTKYGSNENLLSRLIDRKVYEQVKNVFGNYIASTAISERAKLNKDVENAVRAAIGDEAVIDSVQIENIDFSDAYEQSVEARMTAEVEVQKIRQNAEREKVQAQISVTQAQARADSVRAEAEAEAAAVRLKGEAEASAIKAKGDALKENPMLVQLSATEKWNGILPATMVPNAALPFVNVK